LGINYFIELAAKDYIQKYKRAKDVKINLPGVNIREEGSSRIPTYKDVVKRKTELLNNEIIEKKVKEKLESIIPQLKKNIMKEVLQEVRHEINRKFEDINQDYEKNIKIDYEEYIKKRL
jgi:vacuolar-type H+-ATPase subunit I/STV1